MYVCVHTKCVLTMFILILDCFKQLWGFLDIEYDLYWDGLDNFGFPEKVSLESNIAKLYKAWA